MLKNITQIILIIIKIWNNIIITIRAIIILRHIYINQRILIGDPIILITMTDKE